MATYVLVHGGGHGGWCYQRVARILRARTVTRSTRRRSPVSASGRTCCRPDIDLDTHITDVVNVLEFEDLRDVILVGHSYGGMVITGIADRATDRVGDLVYLDAANPVNGQSLVDVGGSGHRDDPSARRGGRRRGAGAAPRTRRRARSTA